MCLWILNMSSRTICRVFIAVLLPALSLASGFGRCPKHTYMKDFNVTKFTGQWFEVERSFYLMELTSACMTLSLKENLRGHLDVSVNTKARWSSSSTKTKGVAMTSKKHPTIFLFRVHSKLPTAVAKLLPGSGFYQVLKTDYENFAILWTCSSFGLIHTDLVWILGRQPEISVNLRAKIYEYLSKERIDSERLILSNKNCSAY